jgi:hypothetical protein
MAENPEEKISPSYPFESAEVENTENAEVKSTEAEDAEVKSTEAEGVEGAESIGDTKATVTEDTDKKASDPIKAITALRKENQALKRQIEQVAILLQQQQQMKLPQQQQAPPDPFEKLDDDDVITVADMKRVLKMYSQQQQQQQSQQPQMDPRELQLRAQYDDYDDAIKQIPDLLKETPHLRSAIINSENPYLTAYSLVQLYKGKAKSDDDNETATKLMDNLAKPRSAGKVTSGSGATKANYYATLDDKGLDAMIAKVKRGQ